MSLYCALLWLGAGVALWVAPLRRSNPLVRHQPTFALDERGLRRLLALVLVLTGILYPFRVLDRPGGFVHTHELFNYTIGSKYFDELGYDGLYYATQRALIENDPSIEKEIELVKNLRSYELESEQASQQRGDSVPATFDEARWKDFRDDVGFFGTFMHSSEWQPLLVDHGYNATPFWTLVGGGIASAVDLGEEAVLLFLSFDVLLLMAMVALVAWAFGPTSALLFALLTFANPYSTAQFTAGAYLRQLWMAGVVAWLCLWRRGHPVAGGLCLAVAALDRIFPLLFLLAPLASGLGALLQHRSPGRLLASPESRMVAAFGGAVAVGMVASATATGGMGTWVECIANLRAHSDWFFLNQISLRTLLVVDPFQTQELARHWDDAVWTRSREALAAGSLATLFALRLVGLALLFAVAVLRRGPLRTVGLISFAPFLLLYPADYYYVFLAPLFILWRCHRSLTAAIVALHGLFWVFHGRWPSPLELEVRHWWISLGLAATLAVFLGRSLARTLGRRSLWVAAAALVVIATGMAVDRGRARRVPSSASVDLALLDVHSLRQSKVQTEPMRGFGTAWSRGDHLLVQTTAPEGGVTLELPAVEPGPIRLRLDFTAAPPFGRVDLRLDGQPLGPPIDLAAGQPELRPVVLDGVTVGKGPSLLEVRAALPTVFALDRVTLEPPSNPTRDQALERAVAWILAHPADAFDGGRAEVLAEVVALHGVAKRVEGELRARCEAGVEARLAALADRGFGLVERELAALAAAADVGRRRGTKLALFEEHLDRLRAWAAQDEAPVISLFASAYLDRLLPEETIELALERSPLRREFESRALTARLAVTYDARLKSAVASDLRALFLDAAGLTAYGLDPRPDLELFGEGAPWARLCADGRRWAAASGDALLLARVILMQRWLAPPDAGSRTEGFDDLLRLQRSGGDFGPVSPGRTNPRRLAVLTAALALAQG